LSVVETEEGLKGVIEYNADLFDKRKIQSLADHLLTLAEAATADPGRSIQELELLNEREKRQIIIEWNKTEREYPLDLPVYMLIAEQAILRPEAIAVIYKDERLSYLELDRRANQLANYLRALG